MDDRQRPRRGGPAARGEGALSIIADARIPGSGDSPGLVPRQNKPMMGHVSSRPGKRASLSKREAVPESCPGDECLARRQAGRPGSRLPLESADCPGLGWWLVTGSVLSARR